MKTSTILLSNLLKIIPEATDEIQCYHWNVKGPNFTTTHANLGEVYDLLIDWTDIIAERIKAIEPGLQVVKGSSTVVIPLSNEAEIVTRTISILTQLINVIKSTELDDVSANKLQEFTYELDKWVWKFTNSQ